jgi:uncharacterized protein YdeI (YjbR/CyaY-like superfamily)
MSPTFFRSATAFRRWLERHHASATDLWVGFYKKASGRATLTYAESVEEALCFGWIDGVRKSIDADSYVNRFTPRRPGSVWSDINTRRALALIKEGRMRPAGLAAFTARDPRRSGVYSFEQRQAAALSRGEAAAFRANKAAWTFFQSQPPGYRRVVTWWVIGAKRPETRARRLRILIEDSAAGRRIGLMQRPNSRRTSSCSRRTARFWRRSGPGRSKAGRPTPKKR